MTKLVLINAQLNNKLHLRDVYFSKIRLFFINLKLEIALAISALNESKIKFSSSKEPTKWYIYEIIHDRLDLILIRHSQKENSDELPHKHDISSYG